MSSPSKILMVNNVGWFFVSHRLPIALAAKTEGYEFHAASALDEVLDAATPARLKEGGLVFHELRFSRSGSGLGELFRSGADLWRLFREIKPDVLHLVTLKPILIGGMVARLSGIRNVILAVPGRGSVFSGNGLAARLRRTIALWLYRAAYRPGVSRVIIQNEEDRNYFVGRGIFLESDVTLIRGSGVDISTFQTKREPDGLPTVVLASRMLKEKGVRVFVEAARMLQEKGIQARFVLVGNPDPGNPYSHTRAELEAWVASGVVEWLGYRSDMADIFASSHIVCLPTFYGEGVPKVLIEAAACGRPIVTTDHPGCRDIVRHEDNGLLVQPRDESALAGALERLIADPALRRQMGERGRARAENEFSLDIVVRQTLDIYRELAVRGGVEQSASRL